jgi:hypothetical protein
LGEVTREFLHEQGLPRGPIKIVDLARQFGILRRND